MDFNVTAMKRYKITVIMGNQTKEYFVEGVLRIQGKHQVAFHDGEGEITHQFPVKLSIVELLTNNA